MHVKTRCTKTVANGKRGFDKKGAKAPPKSRIEYIPSTRITCTGDKKGGGRWEQQDSHCDKRDASEIKR